MHNSGNNTSRFIELFELFMQKYLDLLPIDYTYSLADTRLKELFLKSDRIELKKYSKILTEINKHYYLLKPNWEKKSQIVIPSDYAIHILNKCIDDAETPISQPSECKPSLYTSNSSRNVKQSNQIIELNGQKYIWNGSTWIGPDNLQPPITIITRLNKLISNLLATEDDNITDIYLLAKRARIARENGQHNRVENIARQILKLSPEHHEGLAILCASLRARGFPERALEETEKYKMTRNPALLTSRAAAYCDIGMWEKAKITIGQSLAIQTSTEAFSVVQRIKQARPDLYSLH